MQSVLEHLADTDEIGLVKCGQSNALPNGDRDSEGYVASPHLLLSPAGLDLTIQAIASATGAAHGAAGTRSVVTVAEESDARYWINGELRLVQHDYGEAVASSLRHGHAKVINNVVGAVIAVAFDTTSDRVVSLLHGRPNGSQVTFETTGTLPGLTAGTIYYVRDAADNSFRVSVDPWGTAETLTGGSGTHTARARPALTVEWQSEFQASSAVTFTLGSPGTVNHTAHVQMVGSTVSFTGSLPPELTASVNYYVVGVIDENRYRLSATRGGTPINFSGAGGGATVTPNLMVDVAGYVHLHGRFASYANVQVVTPFQPIQPGDYPAGTPKVPGYTLATDVTSYADAAVVLPFAWNEGIDGYGTTGTVTVSGLVATLQGGQTIQAKLFAGGYLRVGDAKGKVVSNTTTTVTVESWTPTAGPGAGTLPFHLHLPHWRSNPHHFTAGEGFLYPSNNMQPGGHLAVSSGQVYSRPRGWLAGSYTGRAFTAQQAATATIGAALARMLTTSSGDLTVSADGTHVTLTRAAAGRNPATGLVQFEDYLRPGNLVFLTGLGQSPSVDGFWRVVTMVASAGTTGSTVTLEPADATTTVPGSVSGTVPAAAQVARMYWKTTHRFGSLIETAWRMATSIGRRLVVAHLGINGAAQFLAYSNNAVAPQGQIGWWDDDTGFDWTPSNAGGLAARLRRLVEFIAPRAVKASFGTSVAWKVLAIDVWQGETDATVQAGRDLARTSVPTFANWLRALIARAGLSPYLGDAKVPVHWAQIAASPWETLGLGGDTEGTINAAIQRLVDYDGGFAGTIDVDAAAKGADPLHFNGVGEATNGKAVADLLTDLVRFAFTFGLGPAAIDIANEALSLIGDAPNVTALEPPNATTQARLCAQFLPKAIATILQWHAWTFATRRVSPVVLAETTTTYGFSYALQADLLHPTRVLAPDATDDTQVRPLRAAIDPITMLPVGATEVATQPFVIEIDGEGHRVLRTDQEDAVLVYIARNIPLEAWDPSARQALIYYLAHLLAGATLKGKAGVQVGRSHLEASQGLLLQAAGRNAQFQQDVRLTKTCDWLPTP